MVLLVVIMINEFQLGKLLMFWTPPTGEAIDVFWTPPTGEATDVFWTPPTGEATDVFWTPPTGEATDVFWTPPSALVSLPLNVGIMRLWRTFFHCLVDAMK
jgi:hypothetical protein